jgi:hypothetical protein
MFDIPIVGPTRPRISSILDGHTPDAGGGWFAITEGFGNLKPPTREVQTPNRRAALSSGH